MNSASFRPAGRLLALSALAITLVTALAACGDAGAETASAVDTPPVSPAPAAAASAAASAADSARDALIARADAGRIKGSPTANLWLVVISDFECPFCKRWHDETAPRLDREYVKTGKIRIAYLNFPIPSHRNAQPAHEFTMCAAEQDKFWPAADAVFDTQGLWKRRSDAPAYFDSLATNLGIDRTRLRACINSGDTKPLIESDYRRSVRIGIGSTPTFLIGDQAIVGAQPYEAFKAALDAALANPAR
jgi:protein-disulfide isomerase